MKMLGQFSFLSNFHPAPLTCWGIEFPTSEHAYVAAKSLDMNVRRRVAKIPTPNQAKRYGRQLKLRPDWNEVKLFEMERIVRRKFEAYGLKRMLYEVEEPIIEHNHWHDNFWGVCTCKRCSNGKNHLGRILSEIRNKLISNSKEN